MFLNNETKPPTKHVLYFLLYNIERLKDYQSQYLIMYVLQYVTNANIFFVIFNYLNNISVIRCIFLHCSLLAVNFHLLPCFRKESFYRYHGVSKFKINMIFKWNLKWFSDLVCLCAQTLLSAICENSSFVRVFIVSKTQHAGHFPRSFYTHLFHFCR